MTVAYKGITFKRYVLLDEQGQPVRYFDYKAAGTVDLKAEEPEIDWDKLEECLF